MNRKPNDTHTLTCSFVFVCFFCTQGLPKLLLALAFCFVCLFFLRREVTTFSVFEHSYFLNFVVAYNAIENTLSYL